MVPPYTTNERFRRVCDNLWAHFGLQFRRRTIGSRGLAMSNSSDWIDIEKKYYAQTVRRQPVVIVRGDGTEVWDADGKQYLDFVAGWAVNQLGPQPPSGQHPGHSRPGRHPDPDLQPVLHRAAVAAGRDAHREQLSRPGFPSATAAPRPSRAP